MLYQAKSKRNNRFWKIPPSWKTITSISARFFNKSSLRARNFFFLSFSPFSLFSFSLSFSRFCPFCSSLKICNNLIESEDRRIVTDSLCQYYNYWDYYVKSSTMLTLRINASLALKWQRSGQKRKKKKTKTS